LNRVYTNIGQLMTLKGAVRKRARKIQDKDLGLIRNGSLVVQGGRVQWVGATRRVPTEYKKLNQVDCKGKNIFPGFIDAHTHMIFAGDRKHEFELRNRGLSYQQIAEQGGGILSTVKSTRRASLKQLTHLGQERADSHLRQGVTTIEVKSGYGLNRSSEEKMLRAALELKGPQIVTTFLGAHAIPEDYKNDKDYISQLILDLKLIKKKSLSRRVDIFIEKGYFSVETARTYLLCAKELGFDITIHAEQMSRQKGALLALELGAKSADHLICINSSDKKKLAAAPFFTAMLLPTADLYLQCPYPDARTLIDLGGRVALATDFNPGSSPSQNMALVGLLARLKMKMTLSEVFVALTLGGAYALGLEQDRGALVPGMSADFFMSEANWQDFFYDLSSIPAQEVYVKGRRWV
jgi:imidazolonepropionase